jgi:short-subunit dehydrogenase
MQVLCRRMRLEVHLALGQYYAGKRVVITGASSGIGADLALYLAGLGARLTLTARRTEKLEELARQCIRAGGETLVVSADVASREAMSGVQERVQEVFGGADIVIGNAGVGGLNPGERFDLDIHRRTVEVNVLGLANTLVPFIPGMLEQGSGHLVGISSLAGFRGLPRAASYSSTKAAQAVFLESLRVDLKPRGIAVTSVHPGFVETPMTAHEDFAMPFKVPVRKSSVLIARALRKRKSVYLYPWQMRLLTFFNRNLPNWLYDWLVPRVSGQRSDIDPKLL